MVITCLQSRKAIKHIIIPGSLGQTKVSKQNKMKTKSCIVLAHWIKYMISQLIQSLQCQLINVLVAHF